MPGGLFSTAKLFAMTIRESADDGSDFTNPDADFRRLFLGEDGFLHVKDSTGTVSDPYDVTGGGATGPVELDYTAFTSNVSPNATTEAGANTVVTAGAVVFDGSTIVIIEFFAAIVRGGTSASQDLSIWLYDGASSIGRMAFKTSPNSGQMFASRRLTPSAASHTYSIRASVAAGTGLIQAGAGGAGVNMPGYIRIVTVEV